MLDVVGGVVIAVSGFALCFDIAYAADWVAHRSRALRKQFGPWFSVGAPRNGWEVRLMFGLPLLVLGIFMAMFPPS